MKNTLKSVQSYRPMRSISGDVIVVLYNVAFHVLVCNISRSTSIHIQIWKLFLSMECADLKIHDMWQKSIHELVSERVSNVR